MTTWTQLYVTQGNRVRYALLSLLNLCDQQPPDGVLGVTQIKRVVESELRGTEAVANGDQAANIPGLVDRLLEAIDKTEEIAQITAGGGGMPDPQWITKPSRSRTWQILCEVNDHTPIGYITDGRWEITHITRHDPAAVIRRCAADRALIAEVMSWGHRDCEDSYYACPKAILPSCSDACDCGTESRRQAVLRSLAEGYGITTEAP